MEDQNIIKLYFDRDEAAEECVNDTYLGAWNSMPPQKPSMLSVFLGRITRNLSFNKYKYYHADKRGGGETALILDELSEIVSGEESVEDEVLERELINEINSFLNALPEHKRGIFIRRYWYSDSISSIAERYGITENAASVTLNRIRNKLREYLTERGCKI